MAAVQDPNELIAKQFAASRKNLAGQKAQAVDEMNAGVDRQQAITGMSGGILTKAKAKAQRGLEEGFANQEAQLGASEAGAQLQESQYARQAAQQESQFARQLGQQESQFGKQMEYQWAELDENKKTNMLNAAMNLAKLDYYDSTWNRVMQQYAALRDKNVGFSTDARWNK